MEKIKTKSDIYLEEELSTRWELIKVFDRLVYLIKLIVIIGFLALILASIALFQ